MIRTRAETDKGLAQVFLQGVLAQTVGIESVLESIEALPDPVEAVMPSTPVAPGRETLVRRTAEKVVKQQPLDDDEQFALEAIIIPDKRPAIDIIDGDFATAHPLWTHLAADTAVRDRIRAAIPSVGRVELPGNTLLPYAGTGFVVGDGLLMTNRHVAETFAGGPGDLMFRAGAEAGIDFLRERAHGTSDGGSLPLSVKSVVLIHPYWDMALLRVEGLGAAQAPLTLALDDPDMIRGREVALIGYPAFDPRNDQAVQNMVFNGVYNVKRLMPGMINGRDMITSFGKKVPSATHDSSTLGGASGSVMIDTSTGHVVGLHFGGLYLRSNYGVPACDLAGDGRVIDAGVRFAAPTQRKPGPWDDFWKDVVPAAKQEVAARLVLDPTAVPNPDPVVGSRPAPAQTPAHVAINASEWTIPITVSVRVGVPVAGV